jgi:phosphoribosylcarboxyaminoimidazole (NCAIR) mutase
LAIRILAGSRPELREKLRAYHVAMAEKVASETLS